MDDAEKLANHIETLAKQGKLVLASAKLPDEYFYSSLSLCVIDSVFSIGVRYQQVQAVVNRYCDYYNLNQDRRTPPPVAEQERRLESLVMRINQLGVQAFAEQVVKNRQRTSTRNGILKAEAVKFFAESLIKNGIQTFQDAIEATRDPQKERGIRKAIKSIPGQRSGISLQYFSMLAGSDDFIKPDRMILRFVQPVLGRSVALDEAQALLAATVRFLNNSYPTLTPRLLDYILWNYQRGAKEAKPCSPN
ncbi:hypothetical protein VX159_12240 [Dechloromonas sp. ZY10]|uniref:hypothetical protein n=1 Tax=Dechloromonas aquae TaxID=2664436 RepID=UPI0035273C35